MNSEEAFKAIDDLVLAKAGRHLDQAEKIIIEAAWEDKEYKEIAENSPYTLDQLQRDVGRKLWILLTGILGNGERVTKKRLRGILERRTAISNSSHLSKLDTSEVNKFQIPIVGGQPPDISSFYGRVPELAMLKELVCENRCVVIYGAVGIGKSALTAKLLKDIGTSPQSGFDCLLWKSIHSAPSLQDLITELIELLDPQLESQLNLPAHSQAQISVLLKYLQSHRCLLVLDGVEVILQGDRTNPYGEQYAEYGAFFRRLVADLQQSCLVLTSRFPLSDLMRLQRSGMLVHSMKIEGLNLKTAMQILRSKKLTDENNWGELLQPYTGNPLAINIAADWIKDFFGGSVAKFLKLTTVLDNSIFQEALRQQLGEPGGLTDLEKQIVLYLAEKLANSVEAIALTQLLSDMKAQMNPTVSTSELKEALESLDERSLIELIKDVTDGEVHFNLKPLVKKYVLRSSVKLVKTV